jgi:acetyl-CoA acetyltransferase
MRRAVIASTACTPLTKSHRGELNITSGPTHASFAVRAAVERSGMDPALTEYSTVQDMDLWELHEAFASQTIYCQQTLNIPAEPLNVEGGGSTLAARSV